MLMIVPFVINRRSAALLGVAANTSAMKENNVGPLTHGRRTKAVVIIKGVGLQALRSAFCDAPQAADAGVDLARDVGHVAAREGEPFGKFHAADVNGLEV